MLGLEVGSRRRRAAAVIAAAAAAIILVLAVLEKEGEPRAAAVATAPDVDART